LNLEVNDLFSTGLPRTLENMDAAWNAYINWDDAHPATLTDRLSIGCSMCLSKSYIMIVCLLILHIFSVFW